MCTMLVYSYTKPLSLCMFINIQSPARYFCVKILIVNDCYKRDISLNYLRRNDHGLLLPCFHLRINQLNKQLQPLIIPLIIGFEALDSSRPNWNPFLNRYDKASISDTCRWPWDVVMHPSVLNFFSVMSFYFHFFKELSS